MLDDGSLVANLPSDLSGVTGGGHGNSQAEKPWVIIFQPYLHSRQAAFCPADKTPRSGLLAQDLPAYNGGITDATQEPPASSELGLAEARDLTIESYVLNSIFTHKSARYALEGVLSGFATDTVVGQLQNPNLILFSERNSEALDALDNPEYGSVAQDDYDTWSGESALVRWGGRPLRRPGLDSLQPAREGRELCLQRRSRGGAALERGADGPVSLPHSAFPARQSAGLTGKRGLSPPELTAGAGFLRVREWERFITGTIWTAADLP